MSARPICEHCGEHPGTCVGVYVDEKDPAVVCDQCCGHGCEDGRCEPIREDWSAQIAGWRARMARSRMSRGQRQLAIFELAKRAFAEAQATSLPQRGIRLLEEAVELFQACGGDEDSALRLVRFVFARPPGEIGQELGGVGVTTLALAAAAGLSADEEERREFERVLSRDVEEFARRNQAKNDAGFLLVGSGSPR